MTVSLISGYEGRGIAAHTETANPEPKHMILIGPQKKRTEMLILDDLI